MNKLKDKILHWRLHRAAKLMAKHSHNHKPHDKAGHHLHPEPL